MRQYSVLEVSLCFKYEWKNLSRENFLQIIKAIGTLAKRGKQTPYSLSFVVITHETTSDLMDRLRLKLDGLPFVENLWAQIVGRDACGRFANMDPFVTYVANAWAEADRLNQPRGKPAPRKPQHVENRRTPDRRIEEGINELHEPALVHVAARSRWERKKSRRSYDPER